LFYAYGMEKDFLKWHRKKAWIDQRIPHLWYREREVWWCAVGLNVGGEENGKGDNFLRPIVIFKKFNNGTFWGVPLITKKKTGDFYVPIFLSDDKLRIAMLPQLRLMDARRLKNKMGTITKRNHVDIQKTITNLFGAQSFFLALPAYRLGIRGQGTSPEA